MVVGIKKTLYFQHKKFWNIDLFSELPCSLIEVFSNSEINNNIMISSILEEKHFKRNSRFINLKPEDIFLEYSQNFKNPNWFRDNYFIELREGVVIFYNLSLSGWYSKRISLIKIKANKKDIYHLGEMIKIIKWNQMFIEYNKDIWDYKYSIEEVNKRNWEIFNKRNKAGILIDPILIKKMYENWNNEKNYLKYPKI